MGTPANGPPGDSPGFVHIPDPARLELDRAVQAVVTRANDVLHAESRLRDLLRAVLAVTTDIASPGVLDHLVNAARELLGARFAALAVLDDEGRLVQFRHSGIEPSAAREIGPWSRGEGVLGRLRTQSGPLRIDDINAAPDTYGFPTGHPTMRSFLGVPIRARGRTFGALYLADKQGAGTVPAPFTTEDEELLQALAGAASAAVDNARLYEQAQRREAWQHATALISSALLARTEPDQVLALFVEQARQVAGADIAAIALPETPERLVIRIAAGQYADRVTGQYLPTAQSLTGLVLIRGEPLITADLATDGRSHQPDTDLSPASGPAMFAPLTARGSRTGVLFVTRQPGRAGFDHDQLDMLTVFAAQAALAERLAAERADAELVTQVRDHERIAQDLRDRVIEGIFAISLTLNGLATTAPPHRQQHLLDTVGRLDTVIRDIRATVFDLRHPAPGPGAP